MSRKAPPTRAANAPLGALELVAGLAALVVGVVDTFLHPPTGGSDNHQLVLLVCGFVGLVVGTETLRSARACELHRPSWPGPGAAIIAALVGLVFAVVVMLVATSRYVPNPSDRTGAYEYCPPVLQQPDYRELPLGAEEACEDAGGRRTRVLTGALVAAGLLPIGVVIGLRRHGRSTTRRS